MPERIVLRVNGNPLSVERGTSIAAAMMLAGAHSRLSISGEPRAPLCGMGVCFECRAIVNGRPHSRACQMLCEPDMDVRSQ